MIIQVVDTTIDYDPETNLGKIISDQVIRTGAELHNLLIETYGNLKTYRYLDKSGLDHLCPLINPLETRRECERAAHHLKNYKYIFEILPDTNLRDISVRQLVSEVRKNSTWHTTYFQYVDIESPIHFRTLKKFVTAHHQIGNWTMQCVYGFKEDFLMIATENLSDLILLKMIFQS